LTGLQTSTPLNLALDIGNSAVKAGFFGESGLIKSFRFSSFNYQRLNALLARYHPENAIVSTVRKENIPGEDRFIRHFRKVLVLSHQTPLPIKNLYETPETLGLDRLAGVAGAHSLFPHNPVLVIDAGTAITYDLIDAEGNYPGGNISPGMTLRFQSLHQAAGRLPLIKPRENNAMLGKNTREAIAAGVQNGIIYEMDQYIEQFKATYQTLKVLLTGGDCFFFDNKLKYHIFVEPNLILIGLNEILKFNIYAR
jgi:type III pantothenate kinase